MRITYAWRATCLVTAAIMSVVAIAIVPNQAQANPVTYADKSADTATCIFKSEGKVVKQVDVKVGDVIPFPTENDVKHSYTAEDKKDHVSYMLIGWAETEQKKFVDAEIIAGGTRIEKAGTYTYYAQWGATIPPVTSVRFFDGDKLIGTGYSDGYSFLRNIPDAPTKEGYTFLGWYNRKGTHKLSADDERFDPVYYAKWQKIGDSTNSSSTDESSTKTNNENADNTTNEQKNTDNVSSQQDNLKQDANEANSNANSSPKELVQTGIEQNGFAFAIITAALATSAVFVRKHDKH